MEAGSQGQLTVEADKSAEDETVQAGAGNVNNGPRGARCLTMAQAVAEKWIGRYACDGADGIDFLTNRWLK